MNSLCKASFKVLEVFEIQNYNLSEVEVFKILSAFKHLKTQIIFCKWKIYQNKNLKLGSKTLKGWKTGTLSFMDSGSNNYSGWKSDISGFTSIIMKLGHFKDVRIYNVYNIKK